MNLELYNQKREELTGLLGRLLREFDSIKGQYPDFDFGELEETRNAIQRISQSVYENIFKIMLVARFQGGKSTSFNAMLGGSCYSPMGNAAIKCSAAAITVQHVLDTSTIGATIVMRNENELQSLITEAGLDFIPNDSASLSDAREAWAVRFNKWKENPRIFNEKERDFLFICGLILSKYDDPKIRQLMSVARLDVGLDEIGKFAKFPENYFVRYSAEGPSAFSVDEALFAFVHRIDCRVSAEELEKIGALIEDCPGLFANSFDTTVTFQEMADANAVWYLFNARAPEESDIKAIKACMDICKDRIFYSANIKDNQVAKPVLIKKIFPVIKEQIRDLTGEEVEIHPYHALGALLCVQGQRYLRVGRFDDRTVNEWLVATCNDKGCEISDPADCWRFLARLVMNGMYPAGLPQFMALSDPLTAEGVAILRKESHWDEMIGAIQDYVISTKAKSILITDSTEVAVSLIDKLVEILKTREDAARQNEDVVRGKFAAAEKQLADFDEFATRNMAFLSGDGCKFVDDALAEDLFAKAFDANAEIMASEAAPGILDESELFSIGLSKAAQITKNCWRWIKSQFTDEEFNPAESSYVISCRSIIQGAIQNAVSETTTAWVTSAVEGRNPEFCKRVTDQARQICGRLKQEWEHSCAVDDILSELKPVFLEPPAVWTISCQLDQTGRVAAGAGTLFALKEFLTSMFYATGGGLLVGVFCGEPITMVISAMIVLVRKFFADRTAQLEEIERTITDTLREGFQKSRHDVVKHFSSQLAPLREQVAAKVYAPVAEAKDKFEKAKAAALSDLAKGQLERQRIANDCKDIRGQLIGEGKSRQLLQVYIDETTPLC